MSHARTLALFAKAPLAGRVKTRLAAVYGAEWAARFAEACLRDLLDRLAGLAVARILVYAPADAGSYFAGLSNGRYELCVQSDGTLGDRLRGFLESHVGEGKRIVLLGMDSPTVPLALVEQAFTELLHADVVLGPATDGGYYLLGCAGRVPPIFTDMPWSSRDVLSETIARLADPAWKVALLPPWYDVDEGQDVIVLKGHLAALRRSGIDPALPFVEQMLQEI
jgi:uncharacterized protein